MNNPTDRQLESMLALLKNVQFEEILKWFEESAFALLKNAAIKDDKHDAGAALNLYKILDMISQAEKSYEQRKANQQVRGGF